MRRTQADVGGDGNKGESENRKASSSLSQDQQPTSRVYFPPGSPRQLAEGPSRRDCWNSMPVL